MNDFVLRGFCKKIIPIGSRNARTCGVPVYYNLEGKYWEHVYNADGCYHPEGVGFLSAKQIEILLDSNEFWKQKDAFKMHNISFICKCLRENPFLVAKILKDAGEKSKEENK